MDTRTTGEIAEAISFENPAINRNIVQMHAEEGVLQTFRNPLAKRGWYKSTQDQVSEYLSTLGLSGKQIGRIMKRLGFNWQQLSLNFEMLT